MKKLKGIKIVNPYTLSLEKQIEWVEKHTEKVVKRLPTLKKHLTVYDDRSSELYNLSPEEIKLMSKVYTSSLERGEKMKGLNSFIAQLQTYTEDRLKVLRERFTTRRIDSFLDNVKQTGGEEEYEYAKSLLEWLTPQEKEQFTKSKYFFDTGNLASADFVKFLKENEITVGTAKLESFISGVLKKDIETKYFIKGTTRIKLGRPRTRRRKRKK